MTFAEFPPALLLSHVSTASANENLAPLPALVVVPGCDVQLRRKRPKIGVSSVQRKVGIHFIKPPDQPRSLVPRCNPGSICERRVSIIRNPIVMDTFSRSRFLRT